MVNACMMAYCIGQRKSGLITVSVLLLSVILTILLLSRSAWIVVILLFFAFIVKTISLRRVTPSQLALVLFIIFIIGAGFYYAYDLIIERLSRTDSLQNRARSFQRGLNFLMENWVPPTLDERVSKELGSSHNFILDSNFNAGIGGALTALLIVVYIMIFITKNLLRHELTYLGVAASVLVVRMVTNGGGIPNVAGFAGLGVLLAYSWTKQNLSDSRTGRRTAMKFTNRPLHGHPL